MAIEANAISLPPGRKHHYPINRKRTPRKLNERLALNQAKRGMNNADIARVQGLARSTIGDFMARMKPERGALDDFKTQRADVLAQMQAMSLDVQRELLQGLKDRDLTGLTPQQISSLLFALNAQHGTTFDKERLERGQSTSNQSIVSRLMDAEVKELYAQPSTHGSSSAPKLGALPPPPAKVQPPGPGKPGKGAGRGKNRVA